MLSESEDGKQRGRQTLRTSFKPGIFGDRKSLVPLIEFPLVRRCRTKGGTGGSNGGDGTVSMTATDACLVRLGLSGGSLGPERNPSGLLFRVRRKGSASFGAEREPDGLLRPEGTASRE